MKGLKRIAFFVFLSSLSVSRLHAAEIAWDVESDNQIIAVYNSDNYVHQEITYSYEGQTFDLRVIHSPTSEKLVCGSFDFFCPYFLLTKETVPDNLFAHLVELGVNSPELVTRGVATLAGSMSGNNLAIGPFKIVNFSGKLKAETGFFKTEKLFSNGGLINGYTPFELFADPMVID
jgi:hypothetical protein